MDFGSSLLLGAGSFLLSGGGGAFGATSGPAASGTATVRPHSTQASQPQASHLSAINQVSEPTQTGSISSENGPILYNEPNRTSAIDDIRSVVLYIFIITIFFSFFLILPGIRNEKFPTFFCITTSLIVVSIILISLFGTSWHVAQAPISSAYKAFSRDRIQGDLSVSIGLQSVNITLRAHKYYILHDLRGPMIMYNINVESTQNPPSSKISSFVEELTAGRGADGTSIDTELEVEEVFPEGDIERANRINRRAASNRTENSLLKKRSANTTAESRRKYSIERHNVDINYNERFYFIGPEQMRQEHHKALERGLPYPILTVVEYLSQDEAGFSWSRQYRAAGYYSYIMLWLALSLCALMFILHCAAPKYGIYAMQLLGCLLLLTNLTYATLVPRADRKLVIPFEGRSLQFQFGWNFWAVSLGGCLSLVVGTLIVIIDSLFPNFIFTTILDVDFDSHHNYYRHRPRLPAGPRAIREPALEGPFASGNSSSSGSSSKTISSISSAGSDEKDDTFGGRLSATNKAKNNPKSTPQRPETLEDGDKSEEANGSKELSHL